MAKKKKIQVRVEIYGALSQKLHDPKRNEHYDLSYVRMFFDTHEECHWWDLVIPKTTHLYKVAKKKKKLPRNIVFIASDAASKYPVKLGRMSDLRRQKRVRYPNCYVDGFVCSVTSEKISPLDFIELLDKNP